MGIDRIGGKAAGVPSVPSASPGPLDVPPSFAGVAYPFGPPAAAAGQDTPPVEAAGALSRLRSGSLALDGYLDAKVDEAVAPLSLPPAEMDAVRTALRERLASDPALVDLVRAATGTVVLPPADE